MRKVGVLLGLFLLLSFYGLPGARGVQSESVEKEGASAKAGASSVRLTDADCVKCHPPEVSALAAKGARHQKVGCLGCHKGHAPLFPKEKMIPRCQECHQGEPHFTLENCLGCHTNPHTPLEITFGEGEYKKACLTCHPGPGQQMAEAHSAHAEQACNFCHNRHGYIPNCLDCHEAHLEGQTFEDCVGCHQAHKPTQVTYGADVPNRFCGACHEDLKETLESGKTKHAKLACVFCHRSVHGVRPKCETCHGVPHPEDILAGFKGCLDCHQDPHNLVK